MVLITVVAVPSVQAIVMYDYSFTSNHITGSTDTGPFGTVSLTQDENDVDFVVTLTDALFIRTGAGGGSNFVFNGAGVILSDISGTGLTATDLNHNDTKPIHADGAGDFTFGVFFTGQENGGSDTRSGPITFTVINATIDDFTQPNLSGNIFAADIILGDSYTGKGLTGVVDVEGPPTVPEPASLLLLGSCLIGLWAVRKKFKK
jgi:hypothetical protein